MSEKVTFKKLEKVGFDQKRYDKKINAYTKELQKEGMAFEEAKAVAEKYYHIYRDQFYIWK